MSELSDFLVWHRERFGQAFNGDHLIDEFRQSKEVINLEYKRNIIRPIQVIEIVFRCYDLNIACRLMRTRKREIVQAWQVSASILRDLCKDLSLQSIANFFNKDHSTTLHSLKIIDNLKFQYPEMCEFYDKLLTGILEGKDLTTLKVPQKLISSSRFYKNKSKLYDPINFKTKPKMASESEIEANEFPIGIKRQISEYKQNFEGRFNF